MPNITKWGGLGWRPSLPQAAKKWMPMSGLMLGMPPEMDLQPFCPPIYDQGRLSSCTAHSAAAIAQYLMMKEGHPAFTPSRLAIYYWERAIENTIPFDSGASIADSVNVMANIGCPHEDLFPYDITQLRTVPPDNVRADAGQHKIIQYSQLSQDLLHMKACLAGGVPFLFGFSVYQSFESEQVARTGIMPMPANNESMIGGHAVMAVGYNDSMGCMKIRNSWGNWGVQGYFFMPYAFISNPNYASDFWTANLIA